MSLEAIVRASGIMTEPVGVVKVGPRKSPIQPHVWMVRDAAGQSFLLKFSDAGELGTPTQVKLEHETALLSAVGQLEASDPVRQAIPELLVAGEAAGRRYLILPWIGATPATHWLPARFAADPNGLDGWLSDAVDWIGTLQSHEGLHRALQLSPDEWLSHGDYSHYNMLGEPGRICVIDWEDWGGRPERYLDPLHCAVMPTLAGASLEDRAAGFAEHWVRGTPWSKRSWKQLTPFLGGVDRDDALRRYLNFQLELNLDGSADIRRLFELCIGALGKEGDVAPAGD